MIAVGPFQLKLFCSILFCSLLFYWNSTAWSFETCLAIFLTVFFSCIRFSCSCFMEEFSENGVLAWDFKQEDQTDMNNYCNIFLLLVSLKMYSKMQWSRAEPFSVLKHTTQQVLKNPVDLIGVIAAEGEHLKVLRENWLWLHF